MHRVELKDFEKYKRAFGILSEVGGPFAGEGKDVLIVTDEQYEAFVKAKVVPANEVKAREVRSMHRVQLKDFAKYNRAFGVLSKVGWSFAGEGEDVLIVTDEQYQALVEAKVVSDNDTKVRKRGKKTNKRTDV